MLNGDTGTFTCPVNGYYEFTFTGTTYATGQTYIRVEKNGSQDMRFLDYNQESLMSFTWIMKLNIGDKVRLYLEHGSIYSDGYHFNFFNGMLLRSITN